MPNNYKFFKMRKAENLNYIHSIVHFLHISLSLYYNFKFTFVILSDLELMQISKCDDRNEFKLHIPQVATQTVVPH